MTTVRGLVVGDPHFHQSQVLDIDSFIVKTETALRRLKPDFIVITGDLLNDHEKCHMDAYTRAVRFLELCAQHVITFLVIGNHDRRNNSDFLSELHFFSAMKHCANLVIVDYPLKYEVKARNSEARANFLFVPYVAPGRFGEALDKIDLSELEEAGWRSPSIDAIFAHQEFEGVHMGPIKSVNGDKWDASWPLVISGHIHEYQVLQANIIYPGTPLQHTFSESPDKAIILFEFNTQYHEEAVPLEEAKSLDALRPDDYVKTRYARIDLGMRKKVQTQITVAQVARFQPRANELTKLLIKGTASELKALGKTTTLERLRKLGVKFAFAPTEDVDVTVPSDSRETVQRSYLELFRSVVEYDEELLQCFERLFASAQ